MAKAKLRIMGDITVKDEDGEYNFPRALLIEFDTNEEIRAALKNMKCDFSFEEEETDQQKLDFLEA